MFYNLFGKALPGLFLSVTILFSQLALAEGIVLGGTRLVYPLEAKQSTLSVRNSSKETSYLVQSWAENAQGNKSTDFIITPPLYVSNPGDQNMLRVIFSGPSLPQDRETLYYFNAKAIPSVDKSKMEGKNTLMLAAVTRIKMFVRPSGLDVPVEKAPSMLTFKRSGNQVQISNPSPYHITMVQVALDGRKVADIMVAPFSTESLSVSGNPRMLTYSTINDYGAVSAQQKQSL
ncbi:MULTISPECIES: fimbria/pilus periplasmic chaperone [Enterobacter cloacae complex]|uniref:Fimbria/pilus periplasmic chaperone n=1 Tax=Enterobacter cloacae TaxID=550 RepID=A0A7H8UIG8_ENTCL|nr:MULTISPECIES: fimbria/pilus periplasmic chaperone [Enterobacter cloacae complex]MDE4079278.1 fimbria/pilus periplasmic chaperone [Enterobacter pasteurii]QKZ99284.1 fimbria/pilus periplasmic chaperone [Enterobacter cloacae]